MFDIQAPFREVLANHWIGDGLCHDDWQWFYSRVEDRVYSSRGEKILVYSILRRGRRTQSKKYTLSAVTHALPLTVCPCTIDFFGSPSSLIMTGYWLRHEEQKPPSLVDLPISEYIQKLDACASWPFQDILLPPDGEKTSQKLSKGGLFGSVLMVLSFKNWNSELHPSFSKTASPETDGKGSLRTPGLARFQSAYRLELSAASCLITRYGIHIGCDSDTTLAHSMDLSYRLSASTKHYDLLRIVHHYISLHPEIKWIPVQVKGHADDDGRVLTYMEALNVECDRMAKPKLSQIAAGPITQFDPQLQHSGCMIMCDG